MSFSVMTWSVENFFPPGSMTGPSSRNPVTEEHFNAQIEILSGAILERRPDVVALQEIGGADQDDVSALASSRP